VCRSYPYHYLSNALPVGKESESRLGLARKVKCKYGQPVDDAAANAGREDL